MSIGCGCYQEDSAMQRHLSTGTRILAALMEDDRQERFGGPLPELSEDAARLLGPVFGRRLPSSRAEPRHAVQHGAD